MKLFDYELRSLSIWKKKKHRKNTEYFSTTVDGIQIEVWLDNGNFLEFWIEEKMVFELDLEKEKILLHPEFTQNLTYCELYSLVVDCARAEQFKVKLREMIGETSAN